VQDSWLAALPLTGLVFARCGGLLAVAPPLNVRHFPITLRIGIAAVVAVALTPVAGVAEAGVVKPLEYLAMLLHEAGVGLLMGFAAALVFWAFVIAGQLLDTYLGTGDDAARRQGEAPFAALLYLVAAVAFIAADAHHWVFAALAEGLKELPVGGGALWLAGLCGVGGVVREMLAVGLAVAAPALAAIYAAEVTLAAFDRCAPRLNLAALHQPVRWSTGLLALAVCMPFLSHVVVAQANQVVESLRMMTQALGG